MTRKLALAVMYCVLGIAYCGIFFGMAVAAHAEEARKSENVLEMLVRTAVSPIETVLGSVTELERIVVTPSRLPEKLGSASTSVSVIGTEDFDRKKIDTVKEALKDEVGIDIRQAGAFQGDTSLLMRGGSSRHTLIMIDGMKAYDPIAPGGEYNLAHLTLDNVEQIEVLRGSQSALYGSDAMAGVINIVSKKAEKTYVNAAWEGGSFYTYNERFEAGSAAHGFHYSVAGSRLDTKGISQAQAKKNCQERDPYDRTSISGRVDYDIGANASAGATLRWTKSHFALDQGANADDDNAFSIYRESFVTLFGDLAVFEWWRHSLRLGWLQTIRQYFDDDLPLTFDFDRSKYCGKNFKLSYQTDVDIADIDKVIIGYEHMEEAAIYQSQNDFSGPMVTETMPKVFAREGDFYMENRFNLADRLTSTQGLRVSHHSLAGTHMTYRIDGSYLFATGTKVRGMAATGFKAPSLYQLSAPSNAYFGGGNPNLNPEKSVSYEYGMDQYFLGDKVAVGVTYFHAVYRNLIDALTDPNTFFTDSYTNIGKAQAHGIEASLKLKPIDSLRIEAGLTYQKTKDFQNDQDLIRRPERKFFIECFWQTTKKLNFDLGIRYNGPMSDNTSNPLWGLDTYKVKEFVVLDGVINYDVNKTFSVYTRMENIFNKYYEEVRGYTTAPFSLYAGVKAKF